MNVDLEVKEPHTIQVETPQLELVDPLGGQAELVIEAEETSPHINSSYTLNDYLPIQLRQQSLELGQKIRKG